jgi:hypothetical protein
LSDLKHVVPVHRHEALLIILAKLDTSDMFKVKFKLNEKGRAAKKLFEEAKEAFERNGSIENS